MVAAAAQLRSRQLRAAAKRGSGSVAAAPASTEQATSAVGTTKHIARQCFVNEHGETAKAPASSGTHFPHITTGLDFGFLPVTQAA